MRRIIHFSDDLGRMEKMRRQVVSLIINLKLLLSCSLLLLTVKAQECLRAANGGSLPTFVHRTGGANDERITHNHQAIVASYEFTCCGNVTAWAADVEPSGSNDDGTGEGSYSIEFQVWRPSPSVRNNGCYRLVGENVFTSVTLTSRLIRETPLLEKQVSFEPGDVVGFFISSSRGGDRGVVLDATFANEVVWYGEVDDEDVFTVSDCLFPVGSEDSRKLNSLTSHAPVISVATAEVPCPMSSIVWTMSPTPTPSPTPMTTTTDRTATTTGEESTNTPPEPTDGNGTNQPASTNTLPVETDQPTTGTTPIVQQPGGRDISLIIGVVVALILLIAIIFAAIVILVACFLKTRIASKQTLFLSNQSSNDSKEHEAPLESMERNTTADRVEIHKNEAYIPSTAGMLMNRNEAYGTRAKSSSNDSNELELPLESLERNTSTDPVEIHKNEAYIPSASVGMLMNRSGAPGSRTGEAEKDNYTTIDDYNAPHGEVSFTITQRLMGNKDQSHNPVTNGDVMDINEAYNIHGGVVMNRNEAYAGGARNETSVDDEYAYVKL